MNEISVGIGESDETEGLNVVQLHIHGKGTVVFEPRNAILYGEALMNFGEAAAYMNAEQE